ncbi:peptide ABC transporter ATP-binding protein [Arthrobacter sp. ERGS1:01]|uniref:ABC transporter ATP-binding protein n=1 Tax=Arthrobacter sp. ERGS1:01 TaxID=1704044 RepID=UPI0006B45221|nr:dipeptide ABC transporter ATP-binding protein [Arthrobacter sp. ERGS1:01]ALE07498.1 peptide ABC transporter ATP-binding protein [Arthrobacter sp. ERGS1:01]
MPCVTQWTLPPESTVADNNTPLLEVRDLSVTFPAPSGSVTAVRGVNYHVNKGEFLGIVGESGSGKSVSSLAVMGLLPSSAQVSGEILFEGKPLLGRNDAQMSRLRGDGISIIFQDPLSALTPVYTIGAQIAESLLLHDKGLSKLAANARAVELLKIVGIPNPERRAQAFPHEFSGGMRQRAMIAIAIANNPRLIIADEPTTALDVTIQAQILEVLQKAKDLTGAAVVLITHDLGVVAGNADRIAVMYAGRIVETGTVDQVFHEPTMPYTIGLLRSMPNLATAGHTRLVPLEGRPPQLSNLAPGCPFAPRCPIAVDACRSTEPPLAMIGDASNHSAACLRMAEIDGGQLKRGQIYPVPAPVAAAERAAVEPASVLAVEGLVRHFPLLKGAVFKRQVGTVKAVDGVSLDIRSGQTLGLVGESGCGKTTTIMEILELAKPQAGRISVDGRDVAAMSAKERRALRRDIQVVFQDPMASLDPRLPIQDIIAEPLTVHGVPAAERREKVAEVLELVGLDPVMANRYPHEFSGGQRQRIGIARALVTDPKIIVLDEPVSALDVSIQAGVINLLEDLQERLGLSYLFVAHDLAVVRQIAHTVAVMYLGRVVESGPAESVFDAPKHPYTRALLSAVPVPDPTLEKNRKRIILDGDLPSPTENIPGCNFRTRCPLYRLLDAEAQGRCAGEDPALRQVDGTEAACHHAESIELVLQ